MPQINLLSPEAKKKESRPAIVDAAKVELSQLMRTAIAISVICLVAMLFVWTLLLLSISKKEKILVALKKKTEVLATNPKEMERLKKEKVALEKKVDVIDELSSRKFFWFEKLELIADLIPDGVWLADISSVQQKSGKSDAKPRTVKLKPETPTEKAVIVIRGSAVAYKIQDAVSIIANFIKRLQENKNFAKDFKEIKLNTINKSILGGLDIMKFELICEVK